MSAELKPCPFCGHEDIRVYMTCFGHEYVCDSCGLRAHFVDIVRTSPNNFASMSVVREVADERWNRRANDRD